MYVHDPREESATKTPFTLGHFYRFKVDRFTLDRFKGQCERFESIFNRSKLKHQKR